MKLKTEMHASIRKKINTADRRQACFLFSLPPAESVSVIWLQSPVTSRAQRTSTRKRRCCGWESSEVHRGGSPDSSTVNTFLTALPLARRQFCRFPLVFLPSPTFFNYKDHIGSLCLEGKVRGRQLLSAQMITHSLFVCTRAHSLARP